MTYRRRKAALPLPFHSSHRLFRCLDPHLALFFAHPRWHALSLHLLSQKLLSLQITSLPERHPLEVENLRRWKKSQEAESSSIPRFAKSERAAANCTSLWFVVSIWLSALFLFDRRQGSLTARICWDSVIEELIPFGAPKSRIRSG